MSLLHSVSISAKFPVDDLDGSRKNHNIINYLVKFYIININVKV